MFDTVTVGQCAIQLSVVKYSIAGGVSVSGIRRVRGDSVGGQAVRRLWVLWVRKIRVWGRACVPVVCGCACVPVVCGCVCMYGGGCTGEEVQFTAFRALSRVDRRSAQDLAHEGANARRRWRGVIGMCRGPQHAGGTSPSRGRGRKLRRG